MIQTRWYSLRAIIEVLIIVRIICLAKQKKNK